MLDKKFNRETERYLARIEKTDPAWEQLVGAALWPLAAIHHDFGEEAGNAALSAIVHAIDVHGEEIFGTTESAA